MRDRSVEFLRGFASGWPTKVFGSVATLTGVLSVIALVANAGVEPTVKWAVLAIAVGALLLRGVWVAGSMSRGTQGGGGAAQAATFRAAARFMESLRSVPVDAAAFDDWVLGRLHQCLARTDPDSRRHMALAVWVLNGREFVVRWNVDPLKGVDNMQVSDLGHLGAVAGSGRDELIPKRLSDYAREVESRRDIAQMSSRGFVGTASAAVRYEQRSVAVVSLLTRDTTPNPYEHALVMALANILSAGWLIHELRTASADKQAGANASDTG
jgi:hypothetical protein